MSKDTGIRIGPILRHVLDPYVRPVDTRSCISNSLFDFSRCYRVVTTPIDELGAYSDIVLPGTTGDHDPNSLLFVRLFYVGAEEDLDRYLRYLHDVGLRSRRATVKIIVLEQYTDVALKKLQVAKKEISTVLVRPGHLTDYGLLVATPKPTRRAVSSWKIY
jgi:hypothetical protein